MLSDTQRSETKSIFKIYTSFVVVPFCVLKDNCSVSGSAKVKREFTDFTLFDYLTAYFSDERLRNKYQKAKKLNITTNSLPYE